MWVEAGLIKSGMAGWLPPSKTQKSFHYIDMYERKHLAIYSAEMKS